VTFAEFNNATMHSMTSSPSYLCKGRFGARSSSFTVLWASACFIPAIYLA